MIIYRQNFIDMGILEKEFGNSNSAICDNVMKDNIMDNALKAISSDACPASQK